MKAIKELIKLQKEQKIIIKVCDKGAWLIILDFEKYMKACHDHLESETPNGDKYYVAVTDSALITVKKKLEKLLQEGVENEQSHQYNAMIPSDMNPGKFYSLFKMHKTHEEGELPPVRPIISGSGSMLENVGIYVEHHVKDLATQHNTFIQDTPDFLRHIKELNDGQTLPENALLVTIDAIGCYMNIPQNEGSQCVEKSLETRTNKEVPSGFITRLLELIL